jgi:hypothetical protein
MNIDDFDLTILLKSDPKSDLEFATNHRLQREVLYVGLTDLNTGFDSDLIGHFSPHDFGIVIDRCEASKVQINGIEVFRIVSSKVEFLDVEIAPDDGLDWARRLVKRYQKRSDITFSATFDISRATKSSA